MRLYGIPNCDTVKKARQWLDGAGVAYEFADFKKEAPTVALLRDWAAQVGWERLLNRAGTTWRRLDEATQALTMDEAGALALMATQPSLIKRPVAVWPDQTVTVGFKADQYQRQLEAC